MRILGLDEAGRGSVLGPLVVGAFLCEYDAHDSLRGAGAADSKALSPARREAALDRLAVLGEARVVEIEAPQIDAGNLNRLEEEAFISLIVAMKPDRVYLDAPVHPRGIPNLQRRLVQAVAPLVPEWVIEPKADVNYAVVGAASIFAKVKRDARIKDLAAELGALGSGYPSDPVTRAFIKGFLDKNAPLPTCVRSRWGTIDALRQQALF